MNTQQIIEAIEGILPVLHHYNRHKTAHITIEQKLTLQQVMQQIHPTGGRLNLDCSDCVVHYLRLCESWHERNKAAKEAKIEGVRGDVNKDIISTEQNQQTASEEQRTGKEKKSPTPAKATQKKKRNQSR